MKSIFVVALVAGVVACPAAWAWDNQTGPNGQIVDGGPGAQSNSDSHARASAHSASSSHANASGGSAAGGSASVVNNVSGGGGGSGGYAGRAPDVLIPSVGGGGMDCPVVGFGVGGAGLGGGGGFGPSWISPDCNARKLAHDLSDMGYRGVAVQLLRSHFPEVDKAFGQQAKPEAVAPAAFVPSPWCAKASRIERAHNPASCGS